MILKMRNLILPEWGVVRLMRERLKRRFGMEVEQRESPLGHPCFNRRVRDVVAQVSNVV